jgi:polygalacturonase
VTVANCRLETKDDALTLKTTTAAVCRDIAITNCTLSSECNGIKLGTESKAAFRNITISNCTLHRVRLCGIEILSVDGAEIDTVNISNVTMDHVGGAFFIRLGQRGLNEAIPRPGCVRNISLTNITALIYDDLPDETVQPWEVAHGARSPSSIMGLPGYPVENVYLANIAIHHIGTGTAADITRKVEEKPAEYPQWERWGPLPAWGLYARHARNVSGRDLRFSLQAPDARPCIHTEDVEGLALRDTRAPSDV